MSELNVNPKRTNHFIRQMMQANALLAKIEIGKMLQC